MAKSTRTEVIHIQKLTKAFGAFRALDGLDLTVRKGQVHGFLGPNGAGKSTAIRVVLGLLRRTSGDVALFGEDPWQRAVDLHRRLVYVPGEVHFWPNLTGGEIIDTLGGMRGAINRERRAELLERFALDPSKKFRTYSKGNRQKVALIAALMEDVELYIFDEPTSGLDPLMEVTFQEEVRMLQQQGKTVLLSSHILAEVEALCDQVTIIRDGKAVESASLGALRMKQRSEMTIHTNDTILSVQKISGVHDFEIIPEGVRFTVEERALSAVLSELAQYSVQQVVSQPPTLESLFLRHYDTATHQGVS